MPAPRLVALATGLFAALAMAGCAGDETAGQDGGGGTGGNGGGGAGGGTAGSGGAGGTGGTGGVPGVVSGCGSMSCTAPAICCESGSDGKCTTDKNEGNCYGGVGTLTSCDGPEDCDGLTCCFVPSPYSPNPGPPSIKCAPASACMAVICRTAADCPPSAPVCCAKAGRPTRRAICTTADACK